MSKNRRNLIASANSCKEKQLFFACFNFALKNVHAGAREVEPDEG